MQSIENSASSCDGRYLFIENQRNKIMFITKNVQYIHTSMQNALDWDPLVLLNKSFPYGLWTLECFIQAYRQKPFYSSLVFSNLTNAIPFINKTFRTSLQITKSVHCTYTSTVFVQRSTCSLFGCCCFPGKKNNDARYCDLPNFCATNIQKKDEIYWYLSLYLVLFHFLTRFIIKFGRKKKKYLNFYQMRHTINQCVCFVLSSYFLCSLCLQ